MMIKERGLPVLVLFEGWGTAGKGSVLGKVIRNIDPRFFKVAAMEVPTPEERRKPFLYRYFVKIPEAGKFMFLDSGWMDEVTGEYLDGTLKEKEYKKKMANYKYPSVSYEIAEKLRERCGLEVRVTVPGHTQRGGSPCPYDRVFASRLGSEAGELILKGKYGFMVGYKNREIVRVPLEEVAGKLKMVDPESSIVKEAKLLGISFGD